MTGRVPLRHLLWMSGRGARPSPRNGRKRPRTTYMPCARAGSAPAFPSDAPSPNWSAARFRPCPSRSGTPRWNRTAPCATVRRVAELTGMVDRDGYPDGTRITVRHEHPHPGAQLSLDLDEGMCHQVFLTDAPYGQGSLQQPEVRHRAHARVVTCGAVAWVFRFVVTKDHGRLLSRRSRPGERLAETLNGTFEAELIEMQSLQFANEAIPCPVSHLPYPLGLRVRDRNAGTERWRRVVANTATKSGLAPFRAGLRPSRTGLGGTGIGHYIYPAKAKGVPVGLSSSGLRPMAAAQRPGRVAGVTCLSGGAVRNSRRPGTSSRPRTTTSRPSAPRRIR